MSTSGEVKAPKMKKFLFFEKEILTDAGFEKELPTNSPNQALLTKELTCCSAGHGHMLFGDAQGSVTILHINDSSQLRSFKAHNLRVTHLNQLSGNLIVTLGDGKDPVTGQAEYNSRLKIWKWAYQPDDLPVLLHDVDIFGKFPMEVVSAVAVLEDCSQVAVGLRNGAVLLFRGNYHDTRCSYEPTVLQNSAESAISNLHFSNKSSQICLFVVMAEHGVCSYFTRFEDEDQNQPSEPLDERGAPPHCAAVNQAQQLVVGQEEGIHYYEPEHRHVSYSIPDEKQFLFSFQQYLFVAVLNAKQQHVISVYDLRKGLQYIAFHMTLSARGQRPTQKRSQADTSRATSTGAPSANESISRKEYITFVASDEESIFIVTSHRCVRRLTELDMRSKFRILFRKNLYGMAQKLAEKSNQNQKNVADICQRHGDHLYEKGDFDGAINQYVQTLGYLNPSSVICRFLDAHKVNNLCQYLEALHQQLPGQAHRLHTRLLLNCYTKMKDMEKLNQFVLGQGLHPHFHAVTAIQDLKEKYPYIALHIARSHHEHEWYLKIRLAEAVKSKSAGRLPDYGDCMQDAMNYIRSLPANLVHKYMTKYGKAILTADPSATTELLIELCTSKYTPTPYSLEQRSVKSSQTTHMSTQGGLIQADNFVHIFVQHPTKLRTFLSTIVQSVDDTSTTVGNTLLELLLQGDEWASEHEKEEAVMGLLDNPKAHYDDNHALVLVQTHDFKKGQLYLYEKLHMYDMVVQHCRETGATEGVIEMYRTRAQQDPQLWHQALQHFVDLAEEDLSAKQEGQLQELLGHFANNKALPPLPVVQALEHGPGVKLSAVKGYLINWLQSEQQLTQEDDEEVDRSFQESQDLECEINMAKRKNAMLEQKRARGKRITDEEIEYDEYLQEDDLKFLGIKRSLSEKADDHEQFYGELEQAPDYGKWEVVADFFGKGILNNKTSSAADHA